MNLTDWLSFAASFAVVLALLGVLLFGLKKLQGGNLLGMPARRMRVLETMATGPRQKIVLLRVKNQDVLIGITAGQMTTLTTFELTADELAENIAPAPAAVAPDAGPLGKRFAELLKSAAAARNQNKKGS